MLYSFYLATCVALLSCVVQAQDFEPRIFAPRPIEREFHNVTSIGAYTGGSSQETVTPTKSDSDGLGTSVNDTPTPVVPADTVPATTADVVSSTTDLIHASPTVDNSTSAYSPSPSAHDTSRVSPEDPESTMLGTKTTYLSTTSTDEGETSIISPATSTTKGIFSSSVQTASLAPNSTAEGSSSTDSTFQATETSPASSSRSLATTPAETTSLPASGYSPSGTSSTAVETNITLTYSEPRYTSTGTSPATTLPGSFSGTGTSISSLSSKTSDVNESTETSNPATTSVESTPTVVLSTTTQNATLSTMTEPKPKSTSTGNLSLPGTGIGTSTTVEEPSELTTVISTSSSYLISLTSANFTMSSTSKSAVPTDSSSSDLYTSSPISPTSSANEPYSSSLSSDTVPGTYTPVVSSTRMPTAFNQTSTSSSQTSTLPASASRTSTADPVASNETLSYTSVYQSSSETSVPRITPVIPITSNGTVSYTSMTSPTSSPSQPLIPVNSNTTFTPASTGTLISSTASLISNSLSMTQTSPQKSDSATSTTTAPTVIIPTATNSHSTFIPSSIIAQTSASYFSDEATTTSLQTGIPSALPKIVQNPLSSSTPAQPVDTTEVQIGFQWALNYPFVVSHPLSTSQIFTYLPIGIADGLRLKPEQITVKNLLPLDTTAELQFITTVARIFIPTSMVDTLRVDLGIPVSPLYQNPDESVNTLMNYINPAIPFFPGAIMDPGSYPSSTDTHARPSPSDNNGVFNTGSQQTQSSGAKGTTAGIALAAFGGAAAYGAAMFLLARRYKRRKQARARVASFSNTLDSREYDSPMTPSFGDGGALMSGGRSSPTHDLQSRGSGRTGNTARTAQISAPMMSENSLGWN